MTVREYIGARYVPLFMGDWDDTQTYEPLSIVQYEGNSFTSRQYVPAGIEISNETYWAETGNFNAQVEQYREEVLTFDGRISAIEPEEINGNTATGSQKTYEITDDDDKPNIIYDAKFGYGAALNYNTNILPIMHVATTYLNQSSLVYGNNYTATNVNAQNTDFESPMLHRNQDDTMNIDCATFCLLVAMYTVYGNSGYNRQGGQIQALPNYKFNETSLAYRKWNRTSFTQATNRLLTGNWAKMLYDMGELIPITHISQIQPGMVLFVESSPYDDSEYHWNGISHCEICLFNMSNEIIIIDSNSTYGGNSVGFRKLSADNVELPRIKWGWMIPDCNIFEGSISGYQANLSLTDNRTWERDMSREGTVVLYNPAASSKTFDVEITFHNDVPNRDDVVITKSVTLSTKRSIPFVLPYKSSISITADDTTDQFTVKVDESWYSCNYDPYIP